MRAFAIDDFGQDGSVREVETPSPGPAEVRVRVVAASVNPVDWKLARGYLKDYFEHRFPFIPGQDFAGVVEEVGPDVSSVAAGAEVFGAHGQRFMGRGSFAQYVIASEAAVAPKPAGLTAVAAAAVPLVGATAMMSLDAAGVGAGDVVLVVGAAGGVGSITVQLAAARGAHVIAVARGENHGYLRELGAADVVDYTTGTLADSVRSLRPEPVDAIIDLISDADSLRALSVLVRDGGGVASPAAPPPMDDPRVKGAFVVAEVTRERLEQLAAWLADGTLAPPPIRSYPLDAAAAALGESEGGHVRGKLAITV